MTFEQLDFQRPERLTDVRHHHHYDLIMMYATAFRAGIDLTRYHGMEQLPGEAVGHIRRLVEDVMTVILESEDGEYVLDAIGETAEERNRFFEGNFRGFESVLTAQDNTKLIIGPLPDIVCAHAAHGCHCEVPESIQLEEQDTIVMMETMRLIFGADAIQEIQIPFMFTEDSQEYRFAGFRITAHNFRKYLARLGEILSSREVQESRGIFDMAENDESFDDSEEPYYVTDLISTRELLFFMQLALADLEPEVLAAVYRGDIEL